MVLDPRLEQDCEPVGRFALCHLLLMRDARYPWCILVPDRAGVQEIYQLAAADRTRLIAESCLLGEAMMRAFHGDKLNVAALGNVVPQLHVHHIVRYRDDDAWPAPVWGRLPPLAYRDTALAERLQRLRAALPAEFIPRPA